MDYLQRFVNPKTLVIGALTVFSSFNASAFFVTGSTPAGWSSAAGQASMAARSASAWIATVEGTAAAAVSSSVNVAGRAVAMPALLRVAPSAGQVAAGIAFRNPAVFGALVAGSLVAAYFASPDIYVEGSGENARWMKNSKQVICTPPSSPYFDRCAAYLRWFLGGFGAKADIYSGGDAHWGNGDAYQLDFYDISPTEGYYKNHAGNIPYSIFDGLIVNGNPTPATEGDIASSVQAKPITPGLLNGWPLEIPFPVPVLKPLLNPSPDPEPEAQPLRIPQGVPVPVTPATSPATYKTPVIDVIPANTDTNPWQVDVQPKTITSTSPNPLPETAPVPLPKLDPITGLPIPKLDPVTGEPIVDPVTNEAPKEDTPGLCDLYPDIAACSKLDTPDAPDLQKIDKSASITPDSGWGGGSGSCPAPRKLSHSNVEFSFQPVCNFMSGVRPVVIAVAWLAAAFILLGFKQGNQ